MVADAFVDIAVNFTDPMFFGVYNGTQYHAPDFEAVLQRACAVGVEKIVVTGTSLAESRAAAELAARHASLFCTVGCHPTNCGEMEAEDAAVYVQRLVQLVADQRQKVVALGEFGLDYDRVSFCPRDVQQRCFKLQLETLTAAFPDLPLFCHSRGLDAAADVLRMVRDVAPQAVAVVHSFDGTMAELEAFIDAGFFVSVNGCSLRTPQNVAVARCIPTDRLLLETDAPWCSIRRTHASHALIAASLAANEALFGADRKPKAFEAGCTVTGRNEPCRIVHVLEAMAAIKGLSTEALAEAVWQTTHSIFFNKK